MKLEFIFNNDIWNPICIDVNEAPTKDQCQNIEWEIYKALDKLEEDDEEVNSEVLNDICYAVVLKHLHIARNPVIKTFYF